MPTKEQLIKTVNNLENRNKSLTNFLVDIHSSTSMTEKQIRISIANVLKEIFTEPIVIKAEKPKRTRKVKELEPA